MYITISWIYDFLRHFYFEMKFTKKVINSLDSGNMRAKEIKNHLGALKPNLLFFILCVYH